MADEKKTPEKTGGNKVLDWIKNLPGRIVTPFRNMVHELKRVTWPTKKKTITYSIIVLVFIVFMMVVIGLFDFGSSALIGLKRSELSDADLVTTYTDLIPAATAEADTAEAETAEALDAEVPADVDDTTAEAEVPAETSTEAQ